MTRIAHLSDLHFGSTEPRQLDALARILVADGIDHAIVTGDITQAGRKKEFREAAHWFAKLPMPVIAIPGNHDTPVHNLARRFLEPWSRFEEIAGFQQEPIVRHRDFVFAGLNSARRMRPGLDWSKGKLSTRQLEQIKPAFEEAGRRLRICGFHHPLRGFDDGGSAGRAVLPKTDDILSVLTDAKVDVVMTGHVHKTRLLRMEHNGWSFVLSQAGTAVSTRLRGEPASYNVLTIESDREIDLSVHRWNEEGFSAEGSVRFFRDEAGWRETP
ncbi:metallophosphoesterase family protein [Parvularcula lutaonensis]|uniref:Metallophosphoesterase family protein n=1 Tax=Parvularcula lutaonensis TaxID=491923 RepID=A0ABV7MAL4_9PROT|nr:metallophosphoesterase [Parvularcula lutaonensis]GGY38283.1 metallophosphoesterase [Parvularcula lutaonensis]